MISRILTANEAQAVGREELATSRAQQQRDAEDARRYRYLRQFARAGMFAWHIDWVGGDVSLPFDEALDAVIRNLEEARRDG